MMSLPVAVRVMQGVEAVMSIVPAPRGCGRRNSKTEGGSHRRHQGFRCKFHITNETTSPR